MKFGTSFQYLYRIHIHFAFFLEVFEVQWNCCEVLIT